MNGDASYIPSRNAHGKSNTPTAARTCGLGPIHLEQSSHDVRGVARIIPLSEKFELSNPSLNVSQYISSRIDHVMVSDKPGDPYPDLYEV